MPIVTYIDSERNSRKVEVPAGVTVMEAAVRNGIPEIVGECGGACACATCHVYIDEQWIEAVGNPTPMEEDMLDFAIDVKPSSRLSCQIHVTMGLDGLVVHTPARQS